ncbi:unnamed protein product [Rotaria sordida]|uniref:Protein kinase domain-containing protein n=1 Tax=Rotaria sordida TaxID=392033 RepID=A0A815J5Y0_9BILA|nr:unnamed protein product [Rotaria sordida]CAF3560207.1 unnamed protein product [Rotaria sordida]
MLDDNEQCYVMTIGTVKFGLCNRTPLDTAPLSPEMNIIHRQQQTGIVTYDEATADVFSFGLLLYEILPKFSYQRLDYSTLSRLEQILLSNLQSDVNTKAYEAQIHACLDKDHAKRPSAIKLISELMLIQRRTEMKPCMICDDRERTLRFSLCEHQIIYTQY